jgi:hypothetical protein
VSDTFWLEQAIQTLGRLNALQAENKVLRERLKIAVEALEEAYPEEWVRELWMNADEKPVAIETVSKEVQP